MIITVPTWTLNPKFQLPGSSGTIRLYYTASFVSGGVSVQGSPVRSKHFFDEMTWSLVSGVMTIATFTNLISTTNSREAPAAQVIGEIYVGEKYIGRAFAWRVPDSYGSTMTKEALDTYNTPHPPRPPQPGFLDEDQIGNLIAAGLGSRNFAALGVNGITGLSVDPVTPSLPIAVGDNDLRIPPAGAFYYASHYDTFADALVSMGSVTPVRLIVSDVMTTGNGTVPATVTLEFTGAGRLNINTGTTLTIQGPLLAPVMQVFGGAGSTSFVGNRRVRTFYPEWWGAVNNGVVDCAASIQAAQNALNDVKTGTLEFGSGVAFATYAVSVAINIIEQTGQRWHGNGRENTWIVGTGGQPAVQVNGLWRSRFEGITFSTTVAISGRGVFDLDGNWDGVHTQGVQGVVFEDCDFDGHSLADYAFSLGSHHGQPQGSENQWLNCTFHAAVVANTLLWGANSLNNLFIGGNWQDHLIGVAAEDGASFTMIRPAFQSIRGYAQITGGGWDIKATGGSGQRSSIYEPDSESLRFASFAESTTGNIHGLSHRVGTLTSWGAAGNYTLNQLVAGTTAAGNVKIYRVTTAGVAGGIEPTWPESGTVADNTIVWTELDFSVVVLNSGILADSFVQYGQLESLFGGNTAFYSRNRVTRTDYRAGSGSGVGAYYADNYLHAAGGVIYALDSHVRNRVAYAALATTTPLDITNAVRSGNVLTYTPTQDSTLNATTTPVEGQEIEVVIITSGASSFTITFGTNFISQGTLATGVTTAKTFVLKFIAVSGKYREASRTTAM